MQISEAIILCGGIGSRLKAAVSDRPKSMAIIKGKPFLDILVDDLTMKGISHIILSTGYMSKHIEEHAKLLQEQKKVRITIARDDRPLGTGGAVLNAFKFINSDVFLVLNGDTYSQYDLQKMLHQHKDCNAKVSILVSKADDGSRFGSIKMKADNQIISFNEKLNSGDGMVNSGVYLFSKTVLANLDFGEVFSLEHDFFPALLNNFLYGFYTTNSFVDIGTPESYASATKTGLL